MIEFDDEDPELLDIAKQINRARRPDRSGQVRRMTGTLRAWNPGTLQGVVELPGGQLVTNPPVMAALDAMSWAPGDEVMLDLIPGSGGFSSVMILGRVFRPTAANSAKVLQALQNDFAKQIAAEVFAARIKTGVETSILAVDDNDYILDDPVVTDVEVSESGTMLVILSCLWQLTASNSLVIANMSASITGATTIDPVTFHNVFGANQLGLTNGNNSAVQSQPQHSTVCVVTGLNPGTHTVQAAYSRPQQTGSASAAASFRSIAVIGL